MESIKKEELSKMEGGGVTAWGVVGIGVAIVFAIGVIDGIFRPLKCN